MQEKLWSLIKAQNASVPDSLALSLFESFNEFLGHMFAAYGVSAAMLLTGKQSIDEVVDLKELEKHMIRAAATLEPEEIREAAQNVFVGIIRNFDPDVARYLFSMVQSYVLAEVMNVDPDLKAMESTVFEMMTLYLDTNVVLSAVCLGRKNHFEVNNLLKWIGAWGHTF